MNVCTLAFTATFVALAGTAWAQNVQGGASKERSVSNPGMQNGYDGIGAPSKGALEPGTTTGADSVGPKSRSQSPGMINGRPTPTEATPQE